MSLFAQLQRREAEKRPIRIGLIGAGKFGSMYLAQIPRTPGVHLVGIADLSPDGARRNLTRVGWSDAQTRAASLDAAVKDGRTHIGEDWQALVSHPAIDVIVECTGHPIAAVEHCLAAYAHGKHVVNVTVEADAFCGPLLARKAAEAGVIYSLAFGDQPALICDLVDWARTCGFPVVAAGGVGRPAVSRQRRRVGGKGAVDGKAVDRLRWVKLLGRDRNRPVAAFRSAISDDRFRLPCRSGSAAECGYCRYLTLIVVRAAVRCASEPAPAVSRRRPA